MLIEEDARRSGWLSKQMAIEADSYLTRWLSNKLVI